MTSSRTRMCYVQTYFQRHLAHVRIINRGREKTNTPEIQIRVRGIKKRDREIEEDRDEEIIFKILYSAQG